MAWTAPRTFSVAEVQTAAIFNVHIRDNLNYLKGNAGTVAIAAGMTVAGTLVVSDELTTSLAAGGSFIVQGTNNGSFARIKMLTKDAGGATIDWRYLANGGGLSEYSVYESASERLRIPAGGGMRLFGAGGGFMFLSAAAVTTLQTVAPAGTVVRSAVFWLIDHNNTGHNVSLPMTANTQLNVGGSTTYVNADTMTLAVTAGGAITIQRTTGTNGTHDVTMCVLFL
jgi:hypothetical protein